MGWSAPHRPTRTAQHAGGFLSNAAGPAVTPEPLQRTGRIRAGANADEADTISDGLQSTDFKGVQSGVNATVGHTAGTVAMPAEMRAFIVHKLAAALVAAFRATNLPDGQSSGRSQP